MRRLSIHLIALLLFFSCQKNKEHQYLSKFEMNRKVYKEINAFLISNIRKMESSQCDSGNTFHIIDYGVLKQRNCYPELKYKLLEYMNMKLFKGIQIYSQREILYSLDHETTKILVFGSETDRYILYTDDSSLPDSYQHWEKKVKIEENWWYLEHSDSLY